VGEETDLQPILRELDTDGLYVEPGLDWLTDAQASRIEANLAEAADAGDRLNVVLVRPPDDPSSGFGDDLAFRLHDGGGPEGLYLVPDSTFPTYDDGGGDPPTQPYAGGDQIVLTGQQWGTVADSDDVTQDVDLYLSYGDDGAAFGLGDGLVALTGHLADGTFDEVVEAGDDGLTARLASRDGSGDTAGSSSDPTGADGDGLGGPALAAVLVTVVVLLVVVGALVVRSTRAVRARRRRETGFTLPASVLDRVRAADDATTLRRAREAVLALGERIDGTEMPERLRGGAAAWQAALDHYEAAARLLPDGGGASPHPLDVVGALVLARRGDAALDAARRGTRWTPERPCFLDPLHGPATVEERVDLGGRRVEVPLCRDCRDDVRARRRPDVLDVEHEGRPAHYFETDREPWVSTGYGALDPDLIDRLRERR